MLRKAKRAKEIEDPFNYLAQGIALEDADQWEEEPVGVEEFIESKRFLNLKWDGKRGCRPKIMAIAKKLADPEIREAILLLGKGCFAGETVVWTKNGPQTMEDLSQLGYFKVQSYDEDYRPVWSKAVCEIGGNQQVDRYWFSNGMYLDDCMVFASEK